MREFASDDATVVVGTVIDEEMSDRIRVTVVATGIGLPAGQRQQPSMRVVRRSSGGEVNYADLEKPTVQRQQQRAVGDNIVPAVPNEQLLDIPAFLRRQAD